MYTHYTFSNICFKGKTYDSPACSIINLFLHTVSSIKEEFRRFPINTMYIHVMCVFLLLCHQILRLIVQKQNASLHSRWSHIKSFGTSQIGEREREQKNQTPPSPILLVSFDNTCCRGYRYAVFHNKRVSKFLIFDTD